MKADPHDWRLQGQEKYLKDLMLFHRNYEPCRAGWDHDHCEFCGAKFWLIEDGVLKSGYATGDNYHWICEPCFADFREMFSWKA